MPMLMSTGNCPSPSGRNTSALSLAPSRIGMSTSFSTFILYWGADALVSLAVATCSCTVPPNGLPSTTNAIRAQRVRLRRSVRTSRRAPHLVRGLDEKAQRLEIAGPRAVVFQEIAVHADLVEDQFGDRLVAALRHPRAGKIAAAEMHARRHALRPVLDRGIE